jgi:hypothetical protein
MSAFGPKRTSLVAPHMSAFDPKRSKQPRDFDPISFTVVAPRRFQDLRVGDVFRAAYPVHAAM